MGRVGLVAQAIGRRVQSIFGGGIRTTGDRFDSSGVDAPPLPEDFDYQARQQGTGRYVSLGSVDPNNEPVAAAGERRTYARDSSGTIVAVIHQRANGSVRTTNASGWSELATDGGVTHSSGSRMLPDGDVVTSDGISLRNHRHIGNLGNPTSPPVP